MCLDFGCSSWSGVTEHVTWWERVCHNLWAREQLELLFSLGRTLVQGLGLSVDAVD